MLIPSVVEGLDFIQALVSEGCKIGCDRGMRNRSLIERLFSFPWRPRKKRDFAIKDDVTWVINNQLLVNPRTAKLVIVPPKNKVNYIGLKEEVASV